jgi:hypothetical protein
MEKTVMKEILLEAVSQLMENDKYLIILDMDSQVIESIPDKKNLERKLHEVCINHRLALYLERKLQSLDIKDYFVDIEYNRYYRNEKWVHVDGKLQVCRPDIIIHKRMHKSNDQHLLVVEAKKDSDFIKDINKIRAFMSDTNYKYQYGARIIYKELENCRVDFFYIEADTIKQERIL